MPVRLGELAVRFGCELRGDPDVEIGRVATLQEAGPGAISFLANSRYRRHLQKTAAAAVVLDSASAADCPTNALVTGNPYATYARIAQLLYPEAVRSGGRHPSAVVEPEAIIDATAWIGPNAYVAAGARVGAGASVGPNCVVFERAIVGAATRLVAHVTLCAGTRLGDRCLLHPGVVIGADGFGHAQDTGGFVKVPQVGSVVIGDDVEIGANTTIDRAALGETIIRKGAKIDNLVMIAHNVEIGENSILAAQVGIAGSSKVGKNAILSGQVGIADHITVGDNAIIAAKSGVTKDIPANAFVSGSPHLDIRDWRKVWALMPQMYDIVKDFKKLKTRVEELEKKK